MGEPMLSPMLAQAAAPRTMPVHYAVEQHQTSTGHESESFSARPLEAAPAAAEAKATLADATAQAATSTGNVQPWRPQAIHATACRNPVQYNAAAPDWGAAHLSAGSAPGTAGMMDTMSHIMTAAHGPAGVASGLGPATAAEAEVALTDRQHGHELDPSHQEFQAFDPTLGAAKSSVAGRHYSPAEGLPAENASSWFQSASALHQAKVDPSASTPAHATNAATANHFSAPTSSRARSIHELVHAARLLKRPQFPSSGQSRSQGLRDLGNVSPKMNVESPQP